MKCLGPAITFLALCLGALVEVRAEPAPIVEIQGNMPFDRSELDDALLPRLGKASIDTRAAARVSLVQVRAGTGGVAGGVVIVRVGTRERTVPLGERTGPGAARVVALVILDLMLSEGPALPMPLALPPAGEAAEVVAIGAGTAAAETTPGPAAPTPVPATPSPTAPAPVTPAPITQAPAARPTQAPAARPTQAPAARPAPLAFEPPPPVPPGKAARSVRTDAAREVRPGAVARPASLPVSRRVSSPERAPAPRHVRVSGFGGTVTGAGSGDAPMASAGADVRLGLGSWRAGAGLSWLHLGTASYDRTDIGLDGATLRLDAGRSFGELELTASSFAMPSRLRTDVAGAPRVYHDAVLFGGGVAVRANARLGRSWLLVALASVDVFGRRLRVRTTDEVIASTPLVTVSLAVGVSWEVMP